MVDQFARIVEFFDKDETAGPFLRQDGEGGFAGAIYRMAREIDALRAGGDPVQMKPGIDVAIAFVRKRCDTYVAEHGSYDPDTGATEFPGNGDETVCKWEEIIEGLERLRSAAPVRQFLTCEGGRALEPAEPDDDSGAMTPEEIRLENLKQMAMFEGQIVSLDTREPYYLASCDHCGWCGSSEHCGSDSWGDDSDVFCPRCYASGADCGKVAEALSTPAQMVANFRSKLRIAFRKALSDLPEIAPAEIASVLASVHMRDEFLTEGKRLQMKHGVRAVAPRVEQECGAGAWSFMRAGIISALAEPAESPVPARGAQGLWVWK